MNDHPNPTDTDFASIKMPRESLLFGIIGAFLFSLAGGVLYYILYQIGFFASISGVVGIVCAIKGYTFFSGCESKRGIVASVIVTVVVIMLAWYLSVAGDVYHAYQHWYAEGLSEYTLTYFECVRIAWFYIIKIPKYLLDLGLSLLFAGLGCWGYVSNLLKRRRAQAAFAAQQAATQAKLNAQAAQAAQAAEDNTFAEETPTDSE